MPDNLTDIIMRPEDFQRKIVENPTIIKQEKGYAGAWPTWSGIPVTTSDILPEGTIAMVYENSRHQRRLEFIRISEEKEVNKHVGAKSDQGKQ